MHDFSNFYGLAFLNTLEKHVLLKICLLTCSDISEKAVFKGMHPETYTQ